MATPTVSILLIGNELLSGRVKDENAEVISACLVRLGYGVQQLRIVADDMASIAHAVNELGPQSSCLVVSGGIGPTHDDVTAESVARALNVPLETHPEIVRRLLDKYGSLDEVGSRIKMAQIPRGGVPIVIPKLLAPGFTIQNMIVMAGVPKIVATIMADVVPQLLDAK